MRHLILTITLVLSNVALAQQEVAITPAAALSRGNVVCSTAKTDLTVKGEVFSDLSTGVNFSYADGKKFRIKFVSKTHNQDNIVSVTGELVTANAQSKAKSTFSMTEAAQNMVTVAEAKQLPDETAVMLSGTIVRKTHKDHYELKDSSGKIGIEVDSDLWRPMGLKAGDKVKVIGEVDTNTGQPTTIDVVQIGRMDNQSDKWLWFNR